MHSRGLKPHISDPAPVKGYPKSKASSFEIYDREGMQILGASMQFTRTARRNPDNARGARDEVAALINTDMSPHSS